MHNWIEIFEILSYEIEGLETIIKVEMEWEHVSSKITGSISWGCALSHVDVYKCLLFVLFICAKC